MLPEISLIKNLRLGQNAIFDATVGPERVQSVRRYTLQYGWDACLIKVKGPLGEREVIRGEDERVILMSHR